MTGSALHRLLPGLLLLPLLLAACGGDPGTGPGELHWDRDVCTRCNMVLSDRRHAVQLRVLPAAGEARGVYPFDDLGCAVLWLDSRDLPEDAVEIWVADSRNGRWIDARSAYYLTGNPTPMQYGLSAVEEKLEGSIDFAAAREEIYRVEREHNVHGGRLEHMPGMRHGEAAPEGTP